MTLSIHLYNGRHFPDEDIELSDIMDDAEYDFYSNLAEITALEQSYEVLDSK
jgi:hypothetical protein